MVVGASSLQLLGTEEVEMGGDMCRLTREVASQSRSVVGAAKKIRGLCLCFIKTNGQTNKNAVILPLTRVEDSTWNQ